MKILMRPKSKLYKQRIAKCLEFGYEFTTSYKKHTTGGGHIKKIFYNKNIRSFVSYTDKQLHVWREDDGELVNSIKFFDETQSHQISCIAYTQTHMLYLAISTDFKLYIFNEHLLLIGWIPINMRLVHLAYFHEEKSTLITGGIDGCFMFKFQVRSKYEPKQGVMMDPENHFFEAELGPRIEVQNSPLWIKGMKINVKQDMMYIWSQLKVCFNTIEGKILNKYKKLTSYENHITDIFVSQKYKYFMCSTFTGQIIIFKLSKRKQVIHTFTSHQKCVTSLHEMPNQPNLFISASNDNTIRIFSLDKFTELYCFILPAGVNKINLLSEKVFACFYQNQIKIGILHHLALNFYNTTNQVKKIVKMYENSDQKYNNQCNRIMTVFSDQSIVIQSSDKYDPRLISTIFPPPSAQEVLFCGYCMNIQRIFVILVNGQICIYRIDESETALLQKKIMCTQIKDSLGRFISQNITAVTFSQVVPPKHDVEILNENAQIDQDELYNQEFSKYPQDKIDRFLVLGLSKGVVLFIAVDRIDHIYSRFFFHKQAIVHLKELPKRKKFISICSEMNICLWGFKDNKSYQLSHSQMYRSLGEIICMDDNILMSFESGDVKLFRFNEDVQDLVYINSEQFFEHEKKVQDFDILQSKGLFISGSQDCYAKIWNVRRELIREIKFPEPVYSVSFLNEEGDILVGHQGKVSMVSCDDYVPNENK